MPLQRSVSVDLLVLGQEGPEGPSATIDQTTLWVTLTFCGGTMKRTISLLLFVLAGLALLAHAQQTSTPGLTVRVEGGAISGAVTSTAPVRAYKGIPFAAPPVGKLRWKEPQPVSTWEGVRNAQEYSPACMQMTRPKDSIYFGGAEPVSEDCLYLNVWTPSTSANARLPVMVWFYGGGFGAGSASSSFWSGEKLAKAGVVVVTFNYRLGAFGFLAHPDLTKESEHHASGNYAMLDGIAALRWVQKNIGAFGGDSGRVTIFGQSAGASAVCMVMASPLSKGLFSRAIGESPSVECFGPSGPSGMLADNEQAGVKYLAAANVSSIAELREKSAEELLKIAPPSPFRPIVDGYFLPEGSDKLYKENRENFVPLLAGSNADEGTLLARYPGSAAAFTQQLRQKYGERANDFLAVYPAGTESEAETSFYTLFRDQIAWQVQTWAQSVSGKGKVPAYTYFFTHKPPIPNGTYREQSGRELGAHHSAEIQYVFRNLEARPYPWTETDRRLSDTISGYWVNFAKSGDPNGPGLPKWPAYDASHNSIMEFGDTAEVRSELNKPGMELFRSVADKNKPAH